MHRLYRTYQETCAPARPSMFERQEGGNPGLDPLAHLLVGRELQVQDEIGTVSSCEQRALAGQHLVAWTAIVQHVRHPVLDRHEPESWKLCEQLLRLGLLHVVRAAIP